MPHMPLDQTKEQYPKYPHIVVKLIGEDGNAFAVLGKVIKALKKNNIPKEEIDNFQNQAMSGDYNHLLLTVMQWVEIE